MGVLVYSNASNFLESSKWVTHTYEVLNQITVIRQSVIQAESNQRAYLITDNPIFLQKRNATFAEFRKQLPLVKNLVSDNPDQLSRLETLEELADKRFSFYELCVKTKREGTWQQVVDLVNSSLIRDEVLRSISVLRDMERVERSLLTKRLQAEESDADLLGILLLVVVIAFGLIEALLFKRIYRDLKLRKIAESAQKQLADILEASPDYIAIADEEGFQYINRGGRKMLGIAEDETATHIPISNVYTSESIETLNKHAIPAAIENGEWHGETALKSSSGRIINLSQVIIAHRHKDGTVSHFSSIGRDITKQKLIEQELIQTANYEKTQSELLRLFNSTFDQSMILHNLLKILASQHATPVSALYLYDEWKGQLILNTEYGAPESISKEIALGEGLVGRAVSENCTLLLDTPEYAAEYAVSTGLFSFSPETIIACPIIYQEKRLGALVVAMLSSASERDTGFIERLCDQLGVTLHNLQQYGDLHLLAEQLRLRSEEINEKNQQLEEASKMKSEFLATMSHELRTPLNAIIGFSEVMRDGLTGPVSDKQQEYLSDIANSGEHLLSLINDVLDLSKIEAGKMTLESEVVDIRLLLENSLSIVKEKASNNQVSLRFECDSDLEEGSLDPRKIKQIVYNLLSNAVKFTPAGGEVFLRACKLSQTEALNYKNLLFPLAMSSSHYLEILVQDNGIGISPADQSKLFQAFMQIDSSLSRKYEGTGLGLAMVKKLAELHGGSVALHSETGVGSTFAVLLPWSTEKHPTVENKKTELNTAAKTARHVLVVEDDDRAADLIRLQLEVEGCSVTRAPTAEIALAILETDELPDLISLDILLPGMDGWSFLNHLKNTPKLAHIPVIILSIVADENKNKGLSLGASEILQKPITAADLVSALKHVGLKAPGTSGMATKVLLIDDDPKAVEIISAILEPLGFSVLKGYGGAEGILLAKSQLPDLIILDLMMPEISGFAVVEELKKHEETAGIPIIVLTAKLLSMQDKKTLSGSVKKVMEKSEFNHGSFINELRRIFNVKVGNSDPINGEE
jgi:PAS domain S-box-containing protein